MQFAAAEAVPAEKTTSAAAAAAPTRRRLRSEADERFAEFFMMFPFFAASGSGLPSVNVQYIVHMI